MHPQRCHNGIGGFRLEGFHIKQAGAVKGRFQQRVFRHGMRCGGWRNINADPLALMARQRCAPLLNALG